MGKCRQARLAFLVAELTSGGCEFRRFMKGFTITRFPRAPEFNDLTLMGCDHSLRGYRN